MGKVLMYEAEMRRKSVLKLSRFLVAGLITANLGGVIAISARVYPHKGNSRVISNLPQHIGNRISPCKGRSKELNKRLLEADVEKYRSGEAGGLGGIFFCREAFPTLKKYALDPDPNVRSAIAYHLRLYYSPEALQLLVRQIERYPSDRSVFAYAAVHPCYFFRKVKTQSLTQVLTARIKSQDNDFPREEIYLLGCLAPKDPEARKFLEEMSQPAFPLRLSGNEKQSLLKLITYALAEVGSREAEEKVLAEIEAATASGDAADVQSTLNESGGFTNCRIIQRFARLILDKRPLSFDVADDHAKIRKVHVLIGDLAIRTFTSRYGTKFTGAGEDYSLEYTTHTDAEMERIYQRVKRALDSGKFSTCG
jgi:hypothetical protein